MCTTRSEWAARSSQLSTQRANHARSCGGLLIRSLSAVYAQYTNLAARKSFTTGHPPTMLCRLQDKIEKYARLSEGRRQQLGKNGSRPQVRAGEA